VVACAELNESSVCCTGGCSTASSRVVVTVVSLVTGDTVGESGDTAGLVSLVSGEHW
jgi:hypothetical protein